jgi:hypothetical protein
VVGAVFHHLNILTLVCVAVGTSSDIITPLYISFKYVRYYLNLSVLISAADLIRRILVASLLFLILTTLFVTQLILVP